MEDMTATASAHTRSQCGPSGNHCTHPSNAATSSASDAAKPVAVPQPREFGRSWVDCSFRSARRAATGVSLGLFPTYTGRPSRSVTTSSTLNLNRTKCTKQLRACPHAGNSGTRRLAVGDTSRIRPRAAMPGFGPRWNESGRPCSQSSTSWVLVRPTWALGVDCSRYWIRLVERASPTAADDSLEGPATACSSPPRPRARSTVLRTKRAASAPDRPRVAATSVA
mmetsp:Transcript_40864/g.126179  ORF Transcript_40864/g.126179 Transcript_40864/m.126179 type:complete len:224 (+) Transcript_40864:123-794(+)